MQPGVGGWLKGAVGAAGEVVKAENGMEPRVEGSRRSPGRRVVGMRPLRDPRRQPVGCYPRPPGPPAHASRSRLAWDDDGDGTTPPHPRATARSPPDRMGPRMPSQEISSVHARPFPTGVGMRDEDGLIREVHPAPEPLTEIRIAICDPDTQTTPRLFGKMEGFFRGHSSTGR